MTPRRRRRRVIRRTLTAGQLLKTWRKLNWGAAIRSAEVDRLYERVKRTLHRRNALAHSRIEPSEHARRGSDDDEWIVTHRTWHVYDERFGEQHDISMIRLRYDLLEAQQVFRDLMSWAERFVELAPRPTNAVMSPWFSSPTP